MKKGFALLETLIVITFLIVSLLLLYGTFSNMLSNSKKNILYDNASNIYKAYYVKEYLNLGSLNIETNDIKEITCNEINISGCATLLNELEITKLYIANINLKEYDKEKYTSSLNNYLDTLSNNSNNKYRLILEFNNQDILAFASIEIGDIYE